MNPRTEIRTSLRATLLDHLPLAVFIAGWFALNTASLAHLLRPLPFEVAATPVHSLVQSRPPQPRT